MIRTLHLTNKNVTYTGTVIPKRFCSDEIRTLKNADLNSLRKGTGGRSSFNGRIITIFGATGFLGRSICNALGKRGSQIIIPYRGDADNTVLKSLKVSGDLGQVLFQPFDLRDPLSIRKAMKYSNVVINLIGSYYKTKNFDMYSVNVTGAAEIAKACRELNIERFIHFSALNVTENPQKYVYLKSKFYPTKLQGEQAVFEEFPEATVFRPSCVCGVGDRFLWPLINHHRQLHKLPLYAKGTKTTKMPVYVRDVANAVVAAVENYDSRGKIYQAIGPQRFYLKDIAYFCMELCQRHDIEKNIITDIKYNLLFLATLFYYNQIEGIIRKKPRFSLNLDRIEIESTTDVVDYSLYTLNDLGITLNKFEDYIANIIVKKFSMNRSDPFDLKSNIAPESISLKEIKETY